MKRFRKILALLLMPLLAVTALAACGGDKSGSSKLTLTYDTTAIAEFYNPVSAVSVEKNQTIENTNIPVHKGEASLSFDEDGFATGLVFVGWSLNEGLGNLTYGTFNLQNESKTVYPQYAEAIFVKNPVKAEGSTEEYEDGIYIMFKSSEINNTYTIGLDFNPIIPDFVVGYLFDDRVIDGEAQYSNNKRLKNLIPGENFKYILSYNDVSKSEAIYMTYDSTEVIPSSIKGLGEMSVVADTNFIEDSFESLKMKNLHVNWNDPSTSEVHDGNFGNAENFLYSTILDEDNYVKSIYLKESNIYYLTKDAFENTERVGEKKIYSPFKAGYTVVSWHLNEDFSDEGFDCNSDGTLNFSDYKNSGNLDELIGRRLYPKYELDVVRI